MIRSIQINVIKDFKKEPFALDLFEMKVLTSKGEELRGRLYMDEEKYDFHKLMKYANELWKNDSNEIVSIMRDLGKFF